MAALLVVGCPDGERRATEAQQSDSRTEPRVTLRDPRSGALVNVPESQVRRALKQGFQRVDPETVKRARELAE